MTSPTALTTGPGSPDLAAPTVASASTPSTATTTSSSTTSTATPVAAPVMPAPPDVTAGALTAAVLSGAGVAAIVSSWVNTALAQRATRLEERARVRSTLAEAYQAYADYKEFPHAIRRRRADQLPEERIRLSEEVRQVQSRLSYYQAWTLAESAKTGAAYNELTKQLRRVAGASMHQAWEYPALDNDEGMNIGLDQIDLSELADAEKTFLTAVESHVAALTKPWWRRALDKTGLLHK